MADNNYCACNSGESKYTIKLNQQGPAGKKGEQGDKGIPGFSPYISVVQSDDENYILRINNEANSYNTPNLFPKDQLTTWTNNIEAQVQQNTTDLSKINNNFVTLNSNQEIGGYKTFTKGLSAGNTKNGLSIELRCNDALNGIFFHDYSVPGNKHSSLTYNKENISLANNVYNSFITGSDQVWNIELCNDENYYLPFVKNNKKISYAASFGNVEIIKKYSKLIENNLKSYDLVTVREKSAVTELKKYYDIDSKNVLDPTFLLDASDWTKILQPTTKNKNLRDL